MVVIRNLVLVGCGIRGIAEAGAWAAIDSKGLSSNVKRVGGSSAGSIVGSLICLGYTPLEIKTIIGNTDFSTFEDGSWWNIPSIILNYGVNPGSTFLNWLKKLVKDKTGNELTTFKDLQDKGYKELTVFASCLDTQSVDQFDAHLTPSMPIIYAIRASMAIPGFFQAFVIPNTGKTYVDAGVSLNYPIGAFDEDGPNPETLGVHFGDLGQPQPLDKIGKGNIKKYFIALVNMSLNAQNSVLAKSKQDLQRTILVDSLGISATDFKITSIEKESLYLSGYSAAIKYLS